MLLAGISGGWGGRDRLAGDPGGEVARLDRGRTPASTRAETHALDDGNDHAYDHSPRAEGMLKVVGRGPRVPVQVFRRGKAGVRPWSQALVPMRQRAMALIRYFIAKDLGVSR